MVDFVKRHDFSFEESNGMGPSGSTLFFVRSRRIRVYSEQPFYDLLLRQLCREVFKQRRQDLES